MFMFNHVAIVGVGLIGGSLAMAGREKGIFRHITGIGRTLEGLQKARKMGVVDDYTLDLAQGVKDADLVVVATPVGAIVSLIEKMLPHLKKETIITDVGSVKSEIMQKIEPLSLLSQIYFIGGHPIAGTENSGVEFAFPSLFQGRICVLTSTQKKCILALQKVKTLWESVGARVVIMESQRHDRILAAVSHLPHMIAFSLMNLLEDMNEGEESIFDFSAGGLKDFTRIAASHPTMWKDVALMNKVHLLEVIQRYQERLDRLKTSIQSENADELVNNFQNARNLRRKLYP